MRHLLALLALCLACAVVSCTAEDDTTGSVKKCATDLFPAYNPRKFEHCVGVCRTCDHGTTTTCTTSCTLKGAR